MFPDEYSGVWYTDQYMSIPEGTLLFHVYGWDAPEALGGVEHSIGDLYVASQITTSKYGDESLFFRHQPLE